jgi:hypothetical protein
MKRTLETKTHDGKTHCWEGMKEYKLDQDDILNFIEGGVEGIIEVLKRMKPCEYYVVETMPSEIVNTYIFNKYIDNLKSSGLDIGKGDFEYGYKMPLPEKGEERRKLIVFRRK